MTAFLSLLATIFKSKWVRYGALIITIVGALYIGADRMRDSIYQEGYTAGIAYQTQVDQQQHAKAQQQFDILQAKADEERTALNKQINSLTLKNADLITQLNKKENKNTQERANYAKTPAGSMSCFAPNDDGLRIINESFPASSD